MGVNKWRPHILLCLEDEANRQIYNGFAQHPDVSTGQVKVEQLGNGWLKLIRKFTKDNLSHMYKYKECYAVLVLDFDKEEDRRDYVETRIPSDLTGRVFVIGALNTPEKLRDGMNTRKELIGIKLAEDCQNGSTATWDHELLKHNAEELKRMTPILRPILFPAVTA